MKVFEPALRAQRLLIVGRSGFGKSNAAKGSGAEPLLAAGGRVGILDPTDSWFGLRTKPDGVTPAYKVVIFGGEHGDLPLDENAGETMGKALATASPSPTPGITHRPEPYTPAPSTRLPVLTIGQTKASTGEGLSKGERAVLTVLAQFAPKAIPPKRAAAISGYSVRASTWRGILARLRQREAITGSDLLGITSAGSAALGSFTPLPTGPALLQHWIAELPKGQAETLKVLAAIGGQGGASDVAARAGYSTAASTWRGIMAGLRNLDLIEGSRVLKLHEDLR